MAGPSTRKGFIAALIAGTLIVPGVSIALTNGLTDTTTSQDESTTSPAPVDITTEVPATTTTAAGDLSDEDLALACGEEGMALVASETAGDISDIERAALTALREICEEEGSPLPGAAVPEVTEVVVVQVAPAPATTTTNGVDDEYGHDDEYEDDHDEEDERDDDHEDDHEHDDHEHDHEEGHEHDEPGDDD